MSWFLRFDTSAYCSIPNFTAASSSAWRVDIDFVVDALPTSGFQALLYFNTLNYVMLKANGQIEFAFSGGYISGGSITAGSRHLLSIECNGSTAITATLDGAPIITTSNRGITIDEISSASPAYRTVAIDVYGVEFETPGDIRNYDPSASSGTGSILTDTVGGNNGTLVNFPTDDSQWVSYGAASPPTLSTPTATATTSNSIFFSIPVSY